MRANKHIEREQIRQSVLRRRLEDNVLAAADRLGDQAPEVIREAAASIREHRLSADRTRWPEQVKTGETSMEHHARVFDPKAAVRGLRQVVGDQIAADALRLAQQIDHPAEDLDVDVWIQEPDIPTHPDDYTGIVPEPFPKLNPAETVATTAAIMRTGTAEQPARALAHLAEYRDRCRDLTDADDPLAYDRLIPPLNNMRALIEEHAIAAGLIDQDQLEYGNAPYSERLEHFRHAAEQIRTRAAQTPKPDELTEQEAVNLTAAACETREFEVQQRAQSLLDRYDKAQTNDDRTSIAGVVEELRHFAHGHLRRRLELTAKTAAADLNIRVRRHLRTAETYTADQTHAVAEHASTHQTNPNTQESSHEW